MSYIREIGGMDGGQLQSLIDAPSTQRAGLCTGESRLETRLDSRGEAGEP